MPGRYRASKISEMWPERAIAMNVASLLPWKTLADCLPERVLPGLPQADKALIAQVLPVGFAGLLRRFCPVWQRRTCATCPGSALPGNNLPRKPKPGNPQAGKAQAGKNRATCPGKTLAGFAFVWAFA